MPLTFPSSPINGAVSGDYTYDATKGAWRKNAALPVSVTHSDVAPSNPRVGDQWWKSNEGTLFTYYNDGTSSQWVESTNVVASSDPNPIPAGAMMAWGSDIIPANWLLCDGSSVSRSTYASLFAIIGTQYGSGDGTTTFNLPNIKGRTIVGKDASQTEFDVLGETGGAKTHTLTESEIPSHTHTQNSHTHTFSGTTSTDGNHYHTSGANSNGFVAHATGGGGYAVGFTNAGSGEMMFYRYTDYAGSHTHTYSGTTSTQSVATNQNTGGGQAHNNLQPYIVLNYIIKFSAGETPGDSQLAVRVGTLEAQNNATPLSPNYIINGAFDYWQRGTSGTVAANGFGYVSADRFRILAAGGSAPTVTFARSTDVPSGIGTQYSGTFSWSASAASGDLICGYYVENGKYLFAGKTITVSFYAKAATAIASAFCFDQDYGTTTFNLTTSWARYSYTITLPSTYATSRPVGSGANDHSELRFLRFTNAASSSNTVYITGVQVEEGSYATPFRRSAPSLQAELAACQRYYYRLVSESVYQAFGSGTWEGGSVSFLMFVTHPVQMRAIPTPGGSNLSVYNGSSLIAVNSITQGIYGSKTRSRVYFGLASNATGAQYWEVLGNNTTAAYLDFNAEI